MAATREADFFIKHLFLTWLSAAKEEIWAKQVLLRHPQCAVVECHRGNSTPCILKVTNAVLAHLSTSSSRKIFAWKLCSKVQFGLVLPTEEADVPDFFHLRDEPGPILSTAT